MHAAQSLIFEEIFIEEKQLIKVKWEELKERIFVTLLIQQKVVFEMNFLCFHTKRRRPLLNRNFLREKYSNSQNVAKSEKTFLSDFYTVNMV